MADSLQTLCARSDRRLGPLVASSPSNPYTDACTRMRRISGMRPADCL
ncbi:hypothetical protein FOZG_07499 [Fusarium oxysporum Fo47]|uniref:Uncharacterized protein n=1 Tax=Fusarium oxysporum Fo47 TaxID=660027 RepID=W9KKX0_FUSOX|nr:hypothetical protein FOZG_07499 [Fusarium oxysporum Fo47]